MFGLAQYAAPFIEPGVVKIVDHRIFFRSAAIAGAVATRRILDRRL